MKILLVEDNEMSRDMLVRRLQKRGYDVVSAETGQQAIEMSISEEPGLILMDMTLPDINGCEATREIKKNEITAHIPVVGLSAHVLKEDKEEAMKSGCDDYDIKPVDMERLTDIINKF